MVEGVAMVKLTPAETAEIVGTAPAIVGVTQVGADGKSDAKTIGVI